MSLIKRPTMTVKRIAASTANGKLSRGPRTAKGMARRMAASLRHGFYSHAQGDVLLALGEDPRQFQELLNSLVETWQPENYQQMSLVMRLARALWRMERADRIQESLIVEQVHRPLPLPTPLDIVEDVMSAHANKLSTIAVRVCRRGYFTRPEDFHQFAEIYGRDLDEADQEVRDILRSMRRLGKPGADAAGSRIDTETAAESALPEDEELREQERRKLRLAFFNQFAAIHSKTVAREGERPSKRKFNTRHGLESLMAPQDRNGPLMLMQRWEDSNLRQILRITELLTKMKSGKLGWSDIEK